jgi:hypothetical protein
LSRQNSVDVAGGEATTGPHGGGASAAARTLRLVVYTAIVGDYDNLYPPPASGQPDRNISYVCLTDGSRPEASSWTFKPLPRPDLPAQSRNRWAKFHPHKLFPDHNASIYVDGNIEVVSDPMLLAVEVLQQSSLGLYDHPVRDCLFEEARECARIGFDWSPVIREQVKRYALDGYPRRNGLYEANVIVRAHHDAPLIRAMERWWDEWDRGVKRDQLSLMYVLWKEHLKPYSLGRHDARFVNQYFRYGSHRIPMTRSLGRVLRQVYNRADLLAFGM